MSSDQKSSAGEPMSDVALGTCDIKREEHRGLHYQICEHGGRPWPCINWKLASPSVSVEASATTCRKCHNPIVPCGMQEQHACAKGWKHVTTDNHLCAFPINGNAEPEAAPLSGEGGERKQVVSRWPISDVCERGEHGDCAGKIGGGDANHPLKWCGCECHKDQGQKDAPGLEPRIVLLTPPNAPDKHAVFIGKVFIWEFDYEHEAKELLGNLQRLRVGGSPARSVEALPEGRLPNYDTPEEMVDHIVGMVADDGSISPYARDLAIDYIETRLKYAVLPGSLPTQPEESCGTAQNAPTSTNAAIHPTATTAEHLEAHHLPDQEWSSLSQESREKISKWFDLSCKYLQEILDEPDSGSLPSPAPQPEFTPNHLTAEQLRDIRQKIVAGEAGQWDAAVLLQHIDSIPDEFYRAKWNEEQLQAEVERYQEREKLSGPSQPSEPHDIICISLSSRGLEKCNCSAKASEGTRPIKEPKK